MVTSTSTLAQPTKAPIRGVSSPTPTATETVDIRKSRKLLRKISESGLTPRKRALQRKASNMSYIGESGSSSNSSPTMATQRSMEELKTSALDDEKRTTIFEFEKAEIFTFDDANGNVTDNTKPGRLLGHGRFEIFQLHQQKVTYLQCGSVVHPILPRLKILKISRNQFILPLSNPERYWRIAIATGDETTLKELEESFGKVCHFRNLSIQTENVVHPLVTSRPITPTTTPPSQQQDILKPAPVLKTSDSLSSISTAMACFNLGSDTSTLLEDDPRGRVIRRVDSRASSLDLALESFFEEREATKYYTPNTTFMLPPNDNRDSLTYATSLNMIDAPRRRAPSRSSMSASLYQSESSWMDPNDEISTSTPAVARFINMDQSNPTGIRRTPKETTKIAEPILRKNPVDRSKYRWSSVDVYQMVKEEPTEEYAEQPSFRSFLKSFFA